MGRRKIVGVNAVAPGTEAPKEEKKEEIKIDQKVKEDFLEVLYYQTKQRDGLLGEFALDGTYSIKNEKILESLVSLPKVLQEKTDNIVYATTKVGKYFLNFKVELDISESYCSAKLFIIEIEHKLDESIKHIQQLAEEVEIYSPLFTENVFKLWNIVRTPVELDKREFVVSYLELQERNELFMKELSDILAELYLIRMLETLQNCGEVGEKTFLDYKMMIEKLSKDNPGFMLDKLQLKAVLDGVILKNKALDLVMSKGGAEIMKMYADPINRLRGKESQATIDNVESSTKKPEAKTSTPSKDKPKPKPDNQKKDNGKPKPKPKPKPENKNNNKDDPKKNQTNLSSGVATQQQTNPQTKPLNDEEVQRMKSENDEALNFSVSVFANETKSKEKPSASYEKKYDKAPLENDEDKSLDAAISITENTYNETVKKNKEVEEEFGKEML